MTDWLHLEQFPIIVCRPALPKDTPEVLELTRQIWEGEDYVPHVWAEWLADPDGLLVVAEYGGRVAGLGKLTRLAAGEWWLEGLRVHPDLEGRGIASRLHGYLVGYWERSLGGVIRLATASFRAPVQHLSERSGFHKVGEYTIYTAPAIGSSPGEDSGPDFQPLIPDEAAEALDFIRNFHDQTGGARLMDLGWQWSSPSLPLVEAAIQRGQAWWWRNVLPNNPRALLLANEDREEQDESLSLRVELLACPAEDLAACLQDFRVLAGNFGYAQATWLAPIDPTLALALDSAGFPRVWDASLYIYEKTHPARAAPEI
jgi:GNAT superfamily N-acetyltransferase